MSEPLNIVHCFRSPVGGIFRHVRDLVASQHARGHKVGIICDSSTGSEFEDKLFEAIKPQLALGLKRIPMRRSITPGDLITVWKTYKEIKELKPDVIHSHGAKGGAYARMIGSLLRVSGSRVARLYCPHGGSIHYDAGSLKGKVFFGLERFLERMTDRLVFVSEYERDGYIEKVGKPRCDVSLVYNGLSDQEYEPVTENTDAKDFLYIGMMRDLKGPDVFLEALEKLNRDRVFTAHFVGDGPDKENYIKTVENGPLADKVSIHAAMPARDAFAMSKVVVVPSRAESMPYIVLEAMAAQRPIIVSNVGGIPEIFDTEPDVLVEPGNSEKLAQAMLEMIDNPKRSELAKERAEKLKERFSVSVMARSVEEAYRKSLNQ